MLLPFALLFISPPTIQAGDLGSIRAAIANAKPGTRILISPGEYAGGVFAENVHGTERAPIVIAAAEPKNPPRFKGAFQFAGASYLEVRNLAIQGASGNAMAVDDRGVREKPAHHITLVGLKIDDVPGGGSNGIKLAGVDDFVVQDCAVTRWGGCAIDMVGCHRGLVETCTFGQGGGVGIQAKGASADVAIRRCAFTDYGERGVNLGGSTGIPYFRPPLETIPPGKRYESKNIQVEGCTFSGGAAPVAFAGADGGIVRFNTIYNPAKWALRILQETSTLDFVPSRNGRFEDNIILFRSDRWFEGGVNVGPNTAADSFKLSRNWWYCMDNPGKSKPNLPSPETGGTVGGDPMLRDPAAGDFSTKPGSPAAKVGAGAFRGEPRA